MDERPECEGIGCREQAECYVTFGERFLGETLRTSGKKEWGISIPKEADKIVLLCWKCQATFSGLTNSLGHLERLEVLFYKRKIQELLDL